MPRFYSPPDSRLFLSRWDPTAPQTMPLLTFLDYLATNRRAQFELGVPATLAATVPADDPEINLIAADDNYTTSGNFSEADYPYLHEGVRLLHWLRREDSGAADGPWVCRFAGPVLTTEDVSDADVPLTRFTAYDPWAYLFARPCLRCVLDTADPRICAVDINGLPEIEPDPKGIVVFPAGTRISYIIGELLRRTISANGPCMVDAGDGSSASGDGNDYGGTADWTGIIEDCAVLTVNWVIQDGTSVGEAWQQLMETGLCKIILTPIYDPDRPGVCADLNIIRTDSTHDGLYDTWQNADVDNLVPTFSWDRSGHDAIELQRTSEGTERANKVQFLGPNSYRGGVQTSTPSINRYGEMWAQEQFNRLTRGDQIDVQAALELKRRSQGRRVWQFSPTPEFTARPFQDYELGYWVFLYHSSRLRQEKTISGYVNGFAFDLSDEGVETVTGLQIVVDEGSFPSAP